MTAQGFGRRTVVVRSPGWPVDDALGFEPVVNALREISPEVSLLFPGKLAFGAKGPARYFGGEDSLRGEIQARVSTFLNRPLAIGIADTLFAASIAAKSNLTVPIGKDSEFLSPLPIGLLPDLDTSEVLLKLGLKTIGDFGELELNAVLERMGEIGAWCHRLARGLGPGAPVGAIQPITTLSVDFEPASDRVDEVSFAAKRLADELITAKTSQGLTVVGIYIRLQSENEDECARTWHAQLPLQVPGIVDRVRWQLDSWQPSTGVTKLEIDALTLVPEGMFQDTLVNGFSNDLEEIERTVARVEALLGADSVSVAIQVGARHPSEMIKLVPWSKRPIYRNSKSAHTHRLFKDATADLPWPGKLPTPLPALIYKEPFPIDLEDEMGQNIRVSGRAVPSGEPFTLFARSKKRVVAWSGPWPNEEHWWEKSKMHRRVFAQILTNDSTAWLVSLNSGAWKVEGLFD